MNKNLSQKEAEEVSEQAINPNVKEAEYMYTIQNKGKEEEIPYTLVGNSSLVKSFGITLTGKGVKAIADKIDTDEYLHIEIFDDHTEFKITE